MKISKLQGALFLLLIGLLFSPNNTFAQIGGASKTITIVKKTVDKDGNTNVEKTVIEGDEAAKFDVDKYMKSIDESKYSDVNINVEVTKDGEGKSSGDKKEIKVTVEGDDIIIMEDGEKTVVKIDQDGDGVKEEITTEDGKRIKIIRKSGSANTHDMDVEVTHTEDGKKEIRIMKTSQPKGAFFGVMMDPSAGGVTLLDVVKGSPAEEAGLKKGDVLLSINEHNISNYDELTKALSNYKVGDTIVAAYTRDGQANKVRAKLGDAKNHPMQEEMIWKTDDGEVIEIKEGQEFHFEEKSEDGKKKIKKKIIIIKEDDNN